MRYVMVTNWHGYWDKLPGGLAMYTDKMFVPPMSMGRLANGTPTTFLLFSKHPREPLKAWSGTVSDIDVLPRKVSFRVRLRREIRFPRRYTGLADGWYLVEKGTAQPQAGLW
ncbi:MAG: hypothetical protein ABIK37_04640 [candidate division WOR-3 bacterium]